MRRNIVIGLIMSMSLLITATTASALTIDVNVLGILDGVSFAPKGSIGPGGDSASAALAVGDIINIGITVDNAAGDIVTDVVGTIIFQRDQLVIFSQGGFGGTSVAEILVFTPPEFPPGQQRTSLARIAPPAIKINQPNPEGEAGDVWLQAAAFAGTGTAGTGPDQMSNLFFTVRAGGLSVTQFDFDFVQTAGDSINTTGTVTINNAFVTNTNPIPEPGTALLIGLGLAGLSAAGRRRGA